MIYAEDRSFVARFIQNKKRGSRSCRARCVLQARENHVRQMMVMPNGFGLLVIGHIRFLRMPGKMRIQVNQTEMFKFRGETVSDKTQERYGGDKPNPGCSAHESHAGEIVKEGKIVKSTGQGISGEWVGFQTFGLGSVQKFTVARSPSTKAFPTSCVPPGRMMA